MGPVAITLTTDISEVAVALSPTTFEGGPKAPLGQCVCIPPNDSDITLAYIRPLGHASAGDRVYSGGVPYGIVAAEINAAVPTLQRVFLPGNHGGQIWTYVKAGENIVRGEAVALDMTISDEGYFEVIKAAVNGTGGGSNQVLGVAQWNIDDGEFGWVLSYGEGAILSAAAISTEGDNLDILTTAGRGDTQATAGLVSYARALATAAGAGEWTPASIHCLA